MITCFAFDRVPSFARGMVRDLRVRWACEEAGLPYEAAFVGADVSRDDYRAIQPFAQVPAIRDGALELFESGAIVLYIAERSGVLLPPPGDRRAQAIEWMFAALNTIEPPVQMIAALDVFYAKEEWSKPARPTFIASVRKRLGELQDALGDKDYLTGEFTAGDLLMTTVLRILHHTDELDAFPQLAAYKARCEDRPAFRKALADHLADLVEPAA